MIKYILVFTLSFILCCNLTGCRVENAKPAGTVPVKNAGYNSKLEKESKFMAYSKSEGMFPSYATWKEVFTLPEVQDYEFYGFLPHIVKDDTELTLICDKKAEEYGLKAVSRKVTKGLDLTDIKENGCIIPELYAKKNNKETGEKIAVNTMKGKKEFIIQGTYAPDDTEGFTEEIMPSDYIYITLESFLSCVEEKAEDVCKVDYVVCKNGYLLESFLEKTEFILNGTRTFFLTKQEYDDSLGSCEEDSDCLNPYYGGDRKIFQLFD